MRKILLLCVLAFVSGTNFNLLAEEPKPLRILLLTGGHDFDEANFYKMFDEMPNLTYEKATLPKDMDKLKPGLEKQYDVLVTYDMNQFPISDAQRENFAKLIASGMPLFVFHHSLGGYQNWDHYAKMIGGQYLERAKNIDGVDYPASRYKHDETVRVFVADSKHPITKDVKDFTVVDETYKDMYIHKDVHVLLTTDNPTATKQLAWTYQYEKTPIFVLALGHDNQAYKNVNFRKIVLQGIRWCAQERQTKEKTKNPRP